jgi:teichuronic acid exporter
MGRPCAAHVRLRPQTAVAQLAGRHAIGFLISFAATVVLARSLGPSLWGVYGIAVVVLAIAQQLVERGVVGYLIQKPTLPSTAELSASLGLQVTLGTVGMAIALALGPLAADWYLQPDLEHLLGAVGIAVLAYAIRAVPVGLLERSLSYGRVAALEVLEIAVFNLVAIAGVVAGLGLLALSAAIVVRCLAAVTLAYALSGMRLPRATFAPRELKRIAGFALPYASSNALTWANTAAAPLLVGTLAGPRDFGILQMSYAIIVYPQLLTAIIGRVAFPAYSRSAGAPGELDARVNSGTVSLFRYAGGATLTLAVSSLVWVPLVYGREWLEMSSFMLVIAPALAFERSLTLVVAALNAVGKASLVLLTSVGFSVVYWTVALLLVGRLGAIGLPMSYALACVTLIGYITVYRRHVGPLRIRAALIELLALTGILAFVTLWFEDGSGAGVVIAGCALMTGLVLRHVRSNPRRWIATIRPKGPIDA